MSELMICAWCNKSINHCICNNASHLAAENATLKAINAELLATCKVVLAGYDNPDRDGEFDWPLTAEMLRAAIKKAEGGKK